MIVISYREFRQGNFLEAFDRLCNNSSVKGKVSYSISKIAEKLRPQLRDAMGQFTAILKEHAELLEDGTLKPDDAQGPGSYTIKKDKVEDYKSKLEEFDKNEAKIDLYLISAADLDDAKIAATEWIALAPILKD